MKKSYKETQGMCGLDKILKDVKEVYPSCSRNRVYRLQKLHNLYAVRKRKRKVLTTDSKHRLPVAKNLLYQQFDVKTSNTVWVTDITQFPTQEGDAYLAIVKDICTKEIVGWSIDNHMKTSLCIKALEKAYKKQHPGEGLISGQSVL